MKYVHLQILPFIFMVPLDVLVHKVSHQKALLSGDFSFQGLSDYIVP